MFLSTNPAIVAAFLHSPHLMLCLLLTTDLQRGAKLSERRNFIADLGSATYFHHERFHNARL